ncbi:hypothetical protein EHW99_1489 [Erwinia amylovora]|uniref:Uncharacterized protein n=2 Tax=Erwinia amylovora TaxID=552 RepID=A0A831A268_ERWAM|nr:hypothetical protein EaACW_2108 [Erwinia amylovora ACW56400]QJQ54194.1 hypothetical protein EHX00_1489 [Erwinia amylovora]CBA21049.1 hypothetical protein predicted by Glimmer/Critica [Erwinia amylovora CFBP1430]CCO78955.1 hypothetical protein BN432_2160 [Erwinia amylovora Ea356]CCO82755.1 hypothetical protein BN433_2187 [Erwinia amylovora Ea266]CCO86532.1 hypothetical protein BN434_2147 [Erwinia amylovora CFBP 2585]CCO90319.1 hypothetical protein BN435_2151 [Erwinia amylovora 01SFR-BO]CCO
MGERRARSQADLCASHGAKKSSGQRPLLDSLRVADAIKQLV